jgi:hypothetical protein
MIFCEQRSVLMQGDRSFAPRLIRAANKNEAVPFESGLHPIGVDDGAQGKVSKPEVNALD